MLKHNLSLRRHTNNRSESSETSLNDCLCIEDCPLKQVDGSNFKKSPHGGFQEQAGASSVLRPDDISLKSLYIESFMALAKIQLEI